MAGAISYYWVKTVGERERERERERGRAVFLFRVSIANNEKDGKPQNHKRKEDNAKKKQAMAMMMTVGKKGSDGNFSFKRFAYCGICIVWFLLFFIHTSQSTTPLPEPVKESKDPSIEVTVSSSGSITNNNNNMPNFNNSQLVHAKYEVFGKVQGVFFRKYTHKTAQRLGIKGTVRNTSKGTVVGIMEGPSNAIEEFKLWLSKVGSPKSRIDRIEFMEEREISSYTFDDFTIIKVRRG